MIKTLTMLMRGSIADNAQAVHDANAVAILRQQIRDAAGALAAARRELAVALAYQADELRTLEALGSRIATVSDGARRALADGREDLGREAAVLVAVLEDERLDRQSAMEPFAKDVSRLKALVAHGQDRLRNLDLGLRTAQATEAVKRAGINGCREVVSPIGALGDAERTLARLRDRQKNDADVDDALADLDAEHTIGVEARLDAEGYGRRRTDPQAVLEDLRASC